MDLLATYKLECISDATVFFEYDGAILQIGKGPWEERGRPTEVYVTIPDMNARAASPNPNGCDNVYLDHNGSHPCMRPRFHTGPHNAHDGTTGDWT